MCKKGQEQNKRHPTVLRGVFLCTPSPFFFCTIYSIVLSFYINRRYGKEEWQRYSNSMANKLWNPCLKASRSFYNLTALSLHTVFGFHKNLLLAKLVRNLIKVTQRYDDTDLRKTSVPSSSLSRCLHCAVLLLQVDAHLLAHVQRNPCSMWVRCYTNFILHPKNERETKNIALNDISFLVQLIHTQPANTYIKKCATGKQSLSAY